MQINKTFLMKCYYQYLGLFFFCFLSCFCEVAQAETKDFVLVIDAGHGGKDPGAVGRFGKEKDINLNVALRFGRTVEKWIPGVKVVYTRTTDRFLKLYQRAEVANNANADLFVSIHTNSVSSYRSTTKGMSTYILGFDKAAKNLAVAQRENAVVTYESDYKTRYQGFDPKSDESYIIFELMQDKFYEQSEHFAQMIQARKPSSRRDKGVRKGPFLVLKETAMPSVLVELGFISQREEERYLMSSKGRKEVALSIYYAFKAYKAEYDKRQKALNQQVMIETHKASQTTSVSTLSNAKTTTSISTSKEQVVYKVQLCALPVKKDLTKSPFKNLSKMGVYKQKGLYKYTCGDNASFDKVNRLRRSLSKRFPGCFVVAFKNGKRIK